MGFFIKNTRMGCYFLFQGIFPIQGLNPHLLCLLHCSWILVPVEPSGKPREGHALCYHHLVRYRSGTHSLITCPNTGTHAHPHMHPCMHKPTHTKPSQASRVKGWTGCPWKSLSLRLEVGDEVLEPELSGRCYGLVSKPEPSGALDR